MVSIPDNFFSIPINFILGVFRDENREDRRPIINPRSMQDAPAVSSRIRREDIKRAEKTWENGNRVSRSMAVNAGKGRRRIAIGALISSWRAEPSSHRGFGYELSLSRPPRNPVISIVFNSAASAERRGCGPARMRVRRIGNGRRTRLIGSGRRTRRPAGTAVPTGGSHGAPGCSTGLASGNISAWDSREI